MMDGTRSFHSMHTLGGSNIIEIVGGPSDGSPVEIDPKINKRSVTLIDKDGTTRLCKITERFATIATTYLYPGTIVDAQFFATLTEEANALIEESNGPRDESVGVIHIATALLTPRSSDILVLLTIARVWQTALYHEQITPA